MLLFFWFRPQITTLVSFLPLPTQLSFITMAAPQKGKEKVEEEPLKSKIDANSKDEKDKESKDGKKEEDPKTGMSRKSPGSVVGMMLTIAVQRS